MALDIESAVRELTQGQGYLVLEGHFDAETTAEARTRLMELAGPPPPEPEPIDRETLESITTRAPGTDKLVNNVEVWNLIDKGEVFRTMAVEPRMLEIMTPILGADLMLGSWAGRVLFPRGAGARTPRRLPLLGPVRPRQLAAHDRRQLPPCGRGRRHAR